MRGRPTGRSGQCRIFDRVKPGSNEAESEDLICSGGVCIWPEVARRLRWLRLRLGSSHSARWEQQIRPHLSFLTKYSDRAMRAMSPDRLSAITRLLGRMKQFGF